MDSVAAKKHAFTVSSSEARKIIHIASDSLSAVLNLLQLLSPFNGKHYQSILLRLVIAKQGE